MSEYSWTYIDLGPVGKSGIEARWRDFGNEIYIYVYPTDHTDDWKHHFTRNARSIEQNGADSIIDQLPMNDTLHYYCGGFSWGGAIASIMVDRLRDRGYTAWGTVFGAKRPPNGTSIQYITHYRASGDIVPFFMPWGERYRNTLTFGPWHVPWKAHNERLYRPLITKYGLR